jgi:hypothetical protein
MAIVAIAIRAAESDEHRRKQESRFGGIFFALGNGSRQHARAVSA